MLAYLVKNKLYTGIYKEGYNGKYAHKKVNKDLGAGSIYKGIMTVINDEVDGKEVTYESRAAEAVATKATQEVLNTVKKNIEEE